MLSFYLCSLLAHKVNYHQEAQRGKICPSLPTGITCGAVDTNKTTFKRSFAVKQSSFTVNQLSCSRQACSGLVRAKLISLLDADSEALLCFSLSATQQHRPSAKPSVPLAFEQVCSLVRA